MEFARKTLESAINQFLRLDPDTIKKLAALSDKIIAVQITDWRITLIILPQHDGITLSDDDKLIPDATIKGNLFDLCKVGLAKGSSEAVFEHRVEIFGDIETGEKIRDLLRDMDIDWEEHLSKIVGDSLAHQLMRGARKFADIGKEFVAGIRENLREFLQEESSLAPKPEQLEHFFQQIGQLRNDCDRLEARINRLIERKKKQ